MTAAEDRPPQPRPVDRALAYAAAGWPVFPCIPGEKVPAAGSHGCLDATTDPDQIHRWWDRNEERNVAIATGAPGPDVLDVDQHGEAGNGFAAFGTLRRSGLVTGYDAVVSHAQRRLSLLLHRH